MKMWSLSQGNQIGCHHISLGDILCCTWKTVEKKWDDSLLTFVPRTGKKSSVQNSMWIETFKIGLAVPWMQSENLFQPLLSHSFNILPLISPYFSPNTHMHTHTWTPVHKVWIPFGFCSTVWLAAVCLLCEKTNFQHVIQFAANWSITSSNHNCTWLWFIIYYYICLGKFGSHYF